MSTTAPTRRRAKILISIGKKTLIPTGLKFNQGWELKEALKNTFGAIAFIALIGIANALANNAGDYATPTQEEIYDDIEAQRIDLCDSDGWPDDENSKLAFQRACKSELTHAR